MENLSVFTSQLIFVIKKFIQRHHHGLGDNLQKYLNQQGKGCKQHHCLQYEMAA
jgi:hypothetical protein